MKLFTQGALVATSILLGAVSQVSGTTTTCNSASTSTTCTAQAGCVWQSNFNNCVEKFAIVLNEPKRLLPNGAITYSNPTDTTVDVTIRQNWKNSSISWITPVYRKPNGLVTCAESDKVGTVQPGKENTYRVQCEPDKDHAVVTVIVHDGSFAQIPLPNKSNTYGCKGWGTDTGLAIYTVNVPCHAVAPTSAPVPPPTLAPVSAPTLAPVTAGTPTAPPTSPPVQPQCVNAITVLKNEPNVTLPVGAVTYSRPTGMTVDVTITQLWKTSSISWITPVYRKPSGSTTCAEADKVETVAPGRKLTYTVVCEASREYALLTVLVHDGSFAQIPVPVKSNSYGCKGWGNDMGIAEYTLSIPCSACASTQPPIDPSTIVPQIQLKKYAGPAGSCNQEGEGLLHDNVYVLPSMTAAWQYCYKVIVPQGSQECVGQINMTDPAPLGGTGGQYKPVVTNGGSLCPGGSMFFPGLVTVQGAVNPEGPYDATVVGKGVQSGKSVTDLDPASITPDFQPSIKITKYAGPVGKCGVDMSAMVDGTYSTGPDFTFQYCYVVQNNGNECLNAVSMVDDELAVSGIQEPKAVVGTIKPGKLCPGEKVTISGPPSSTTTGEPLVDATVIGTGEYTQVNVTSADPAAVVLSRCPMPTGSNLNCPGMSSVVLVNVNGTTKEDDDLDMIYGITPTDGSSVKFKVNSKFLTPMNMYVQYKKPSDSRLGGWSQACEDQVGVSGCSPMATQIEADCLYADGEPYTLIQVYYLDPTASSPLIFGSVKVDKCCENVPAQVPANAVAQYSFILRCECPTPTNLRRLEQKSINVEKIQALFQQQ